MTRVRFILLLLCFICARAVAQPVYLLNKPFAQKWHYIDSLDKSFNGEKAEEETGMINSLEIWAGEHSDDEFAGTLTLYKLRRKRAANLLDMGTEQKLQDLVTSAHTNKQEYLEAEALQSLGDYYEQNYQKNGAAFENYLAAYKIYSKLTPELFPPMHEYMCSLARAYYGYNDMDNAIKFYKEALTIKPGRVVDNQYTIYNTIGLCYRKLAQYDSAEWYFRKVYVDAGKNNSKAWVGISGGNIGITYFQQKRYAEAIPLLKQDIESSLATTQIQNAVGSMNVLASIYYINNQLDSSEQLLAQALEICNNKSFWGTRYDLAVQLYTQLSKVYAAKNEVGKAYIYADSALAAKDSLDKQHDALGLAKAQERIDFVDHKLEREQLELERLELAKKRNETGFFIAGIVVMLLVIAFIIKSYKQLSVEKKKSEDLLLNILPPEVAAELKEKGTASARQFDDVTVLFTDFVHFTEASERMNPTQLVGELHACFKAFDDILNKYNIEKIKTVGDAYLAVSGLPVANAQHAVDVVAAAIEIRNFMLQRKAELGNATFEIRLGIHSGSVVAGIVGVKKFAYDIWGDTVNLAARMEQHSESGKINISESTYQLVKGTYNCVHRGKIEAKNKGVVDMYYVEA